MQFSELFSANGNVVIHQPDFIPYLGFFERLVGCDLLIVQDAVQFNKRGWTHRDLINSANGPIWLSLPLNKREMSSKSKINEIFILNDTGWRKKHLDLIKSSYAKSSHFKEIFHFVSECYYFPSCRMSEFNMNFIFHILDLLRLTPKVVFASDLNASGRSNELLVNQLKEVKRSTYLSGDGAKDYLDEKYFIDNGIKVVWQNFKHPVYQQNFSGFVSHLSILDSLFNCGVSGTRNILFGDAE